MHFELVAVVVLVLIWVITHLLRGNDEERNLNRSRRPGGEGQSGRSSRRPPSEIDRFLDEVNRRRRQATERRSTEPPREKAPLILMPAPRTRTPARTPAARPAPPVAPPRRSAPVVERPIPLEVFEFAPVTVVEAPPKPPAPRVTPRATPVAGEGITLEEVPGPVAQVTALLNTPDSLRTAVLLQEILGPPICRRRGSR